VLWCCFALVLSVTISAFGQSDTAAISGFVKDPTGSIIPNASVSIISEITGVERKATTNDQGYYIVSNLPPGLYIIGVEAPGFKRFLQSGNKLDANVNLRLDAALEIGALSETVSVVATISQIQSDSATVGKTVESKQIEKMMLNGRNPLFLALLKPGVRGGSLAGFSFGLTSGGFSINGSRTQDL